MPAKNMIAMHPFGIKSQFLPTSGILATPKLAVRSPDVHFPKPETLCNRATRRFFAVQNSVQVSVINAGAPSKGVLTTLAFNCDSQQINNVIIVKYKCLPAQSAGESKGTSFVIDDVRLAKADNLRNRSAHSSPAGQIRV
jgi:hypothetical protein